MSALERLKSIVGGNTKAIEINRKAIKDICEIQVKVADQRDKQFMKFEGRIVALESENKKPWWKRLFGR